MVWNTARIIKIWQRHEVSKCYRKNGASVLAWHSIAINVHFFLKHYLWSTVKQVGLYFWVFLYINQHTSGHRWELICENVCMFPCYQLHQNWSICANGNICKLWANGLRYVGAPRPVHDHRNASSKLHWRELKNQGTFLAFQGLRVCASTAGGMDSIPGQGTKIPHAAWPQTPQKEKGNSKKTWFWLFLEFSHQSYSPNVFSG